MERTRAIGAMVLVAGLAASPAHGADTWTIEPIGDACGLTVTHDQLRDDAHSERSGGGPMILSGLKTLLETGQSLTTPGSLRYAAS